ncbi:MAG: hypothetical protein WC223_01425 [Bacteroidales bacterium]|jgi:hypothetical protein
MRTETINKITTEFKMPKTIGDPVIVNCIMPDGSKQHVGYIYQNISDDDEFSTIYVSTDNEGEQVFPPTDNWQDLEDRFERYAKKVSQKDFDEKKIEIYLSDYEAKLNEIKDLRDSKKINSKCREINF